MRARRSPLLALSLGAVVLAGMIPAGARADTTYQLNLYKSAGYLTQDPYYTACTAASAMIMLNLIALNGTGGVGFHWQTNRVKNSPTNYRDLTSILWWERQHDTLAIGASGSDAHGWRNALNYFGWDARAVTDPAHRVYDDRAFTSFSAAVHAAVRAIAVYRKPVGILGWAGKHAQVITGYVATGADPAVSNAFTVTWVYLSDPLAVDKMANKAINMAGLQVGYWRNRFVPYRMTDSPYDDPYSPGFKRSSVTYSPSEWYGRWVIVAPIRYDPTGTPPPPPTGSPSPTPTPTPSPTVTPSSTPIDSPTATPTSSAPAATVSTQATGSPADPTASASPSASPTPTSTPADTTTTSGQSASPSDSPLPSPSASPSDSPPPSPSASP